MTQRENNRKLDKKTTVNLNLKLRDRRDLECCISDLELAVRLIREELYDQDPLDAVLHRVWLAEGDTLDGLKHIQGFLKRHGYKR